MEKTAVTVDDSLLTHILHNYVVTYYKYILNQKLCAVDIL